MIFERFEYTLSGLRSSDRGSWVRYEDCAKERQRLLIEIEQLKQQLAQCYQDDRTCMNYLQTVRSIVGGDDYLDMIQRIQALINEDKP